jgi:hypothetical protein
VDALAAAHCREIIVETASTRGNRPRLREALGALQPGDTLVIYKPDRVARSMKELLVLLEDQLHARGGPAHPDRHLRRDPPPRRGRSSQIRCCSWWPRWPREMERDLIRERILDGLRAPDAQVGAAAARLQSTTTSWPSPAPGSPAESRSPRSPGT